MTRDGPVTVITPGLGPGPISWYSRPAPGQMTIHATCQAWCEVSPLSVREDASVLAQSCFEAQNCSPKKQPALKSAETKALAAMTTGSSQQFS